MVMVMVFIFDQICLLSASQSLAHDWDSGP